MSTELMRSSGGMFGGTKLQRQVSHEIGLARAAGELVAVQETAKLEAIANVTEAALLATSQVSVIEALLIERTPHAEGRLRHIADAGCAGMANIVLGAGWRF